MAAILIVHGISNQYRGEHELHAGWFPALLDGLERAAHKPLPLPGDCVCPFYGDIFRADEQLGFRGNADASAVEEASADEAALLEAIWRSGARNDADVPSPEEFTDTLLYAPRIAERALAALARSTYLARYTPIQFFGDLTQVVAYLNDGDIRRRILDRILPHIGGDTKIVIGHSLGSVVAYEAICETPASVRSLLTLGSPLGIRNVVFDKLTPQPGGFGLGRWPGRVEHWTNIAAVGDIVAAEKQLAPLFRADLEDVVIDSGWDAHSSTRYLNTGAAGATVARALTL